MEFYYRIDFNEEIREKLLKLVIENDELKTLVVNAKKIKKSSKKVEASAKASKAKAKKSLEKIQNAINILNLENKNLSIYAISKVAGISWITVKKYREKFGY